MEVWGQILQRLAIFEIYYQNIQFRHVSAEILLKNLPNLFIIERLVYASM